MSDPRPPNPTQLSTGLPGLTHHITGHHSNGTAKIASTRPATWTTLLNNSMAFNVVYTTSQFPVSLNSDADLHTHDQLLESGKLGLVNPNGTVARIVDLAPGSEPLMHRTQSLDYGIVLEGEVEMWLDDGTKQVMRRGDVAVQRGTSHGWRNTSETEWCRMFFVLQDCQKVEVGGKSLGEDVSHAADVKGLESARGGETSKI